MIFKKKSKPIAISNRILNGTNVKGNIESEGDLRIDGEISGDIKIKGKLVIGLEGKIIGNIDCKSAKIEGKHSGDLVAHDTVHLLAQSIVEGTIMTARLIIDEGALFNGTCKMITENQSIKHSTAEKMNV